MHDEEMTLGQWLVTLLLLIIPCVNIVLLFVWAFSANTPIDKKRFAQAELIFAAIGLVLSIIFYAVFGAAMLTLFSTMGV